MVMIDLNRASAHDIANAGIEPAIARELTFWSPFRSWEDLLWVNGVDDTILDQLRTGFEIGTGADSSWPAPKPFKLSAGAAH